MRVRAMGIAIVMIELLASAPTRAEDQRIAVARAAYLGADHDRTVAVLVPAMPSLPERERGRAWRLVGCAQMVLGDRTAAIKAFRESFTLEPDAALEPELSSSPDARGLFEEARGLWHSELIIAMQAHAADIKRLAVVVDAPVRTKGGRPVAIAIRVDDPAHLAARVELSFRRRGQPTFTSMTQALRPGTTAAFAVPADVTESKQAFLLDYHVTIRHASGFDLRRDGDADRPHTIAVSAGRRPSWRDSWWVRGSIGLGVVGLGVGGYLFYRSIDVGPQHVMVGAP